MTTNDLFGGTSNIVQSYDIGAGSTVTALTYKLTITTIGGSYLSEGVDLS